MFTILNVYTENSQSALSIDPARVQRIVEEVVSSEKKKFDEASIHFVTTEEICALHAEYFDDPSPTDCISFPIDNSDGGYRVLGDVFVCPETAIEYAGENGGDPYEEATLYIVHGVLHLLGYRDIEEEEEKEMRAGEARHMKHLKSLNLLLNA